MDTLPPSGEAATLVDARSPPPARTDVGSGSQLGRYIVLERVGAGGMGTVFAAWDPELDRKLALKLLNSRAEHEQGDDAATARLRNEAQAIAGLAHPNIIKIHDVGTHAGCPFLVMEFVEGQTLREWVAQEAPSWEQILARYCAAGAGLAAAHAAGCIHRDFKPENVMLGGDGRVRVLDFGLARRDGAADPARRAEHQAKDTLSLTGTPDYMSPEQVEAAALDARSDQFSFCVALWEALCGEHPFPASTLAARLSAVCRGAHAPFANDEVPAKIQRALERGLCVDPSQRWPDMSTLLAALSARPRKRRQQQLAAVAALSVGLLAAGLQLGRRGSDQIDCQTSLALLDRAWDARAHDTLQRSFAPFDSASDATNLADIRAQLDTWTEDWARLASSNCEAYHQQHRQSAELFDLRAACLDESLGGFEDLLALLAETPSPPLSVLTALERGELLPRLERCDEAVTLRGAALPLEPARAREYKAVHRQMQRARQLFQLSRFPEVLVELEAIAAQIQALDHPPLTSVYTQLLVQSRMPLGKVQQGDAIEALVTAQRARDEPAQTLGALMLARQALKDGTPEESARWLSFAEAGELVSAGNQLEVVKARAFLAMSRERPLDALEAFEASIATARALTSSSRSFVIAEELSSYGYVAAQLAWLRPELAALALDAEREAMDIARERTLPHTYSRLAIRLNFAYAHARAGQAERAQNLVESTGEQIVESYGDQTPIYEAYLRRRHTFAMLQDDCELADASATQHLDWTRRNRSHDPTGLAKSLLRAATRCALPRAQALALLDEAVTLQWPEQGGPVHPVTAVRARLTRALHRLREPGEPESLHTAQQDLERARELLDDSMILLRTRQEAVELLLELFCAQSQRPSPQREATLAALRELQQRIDPMLDRDLERLVSEQLARAG